MEKEKTLADLKPGDTAIVKKLDSQDITRRRLQDIGLIEGTKVLCLFKSLSNNPVAYLIRGAVIAIRKEDGSTVILY